MRFARLAWLLFLLPGATVTATLGCFVKDETDVRQLRTDIGERGVAALVAAAQGPHARP